MNNWEIILLGDAATFVNGYAFKPKDWGKEGKEIIRIQNLTKSSKEINYFSGSIPEKYLIKKGDLLISWSATLGVYEWKGNDAWLNQHIFKVVFDKREFDKRFFKFLIQSSLKEMSRNIHGSTMKHITKKRFDNLQIPLPPLSTQKKIADLLDTADALRQKTQAIIDHYDQLAQSLFLEMFGDPVKNPKGWEKKELGKLQKTKCQNGHYAPKDDYSDQGIKMVHMSDAFYNKVKPENLKRVIVDDKKLEKYKLKATDLLLSRRSLNYEGSAKPCLIPEFYEHLIYESSLIRIRPNSNIINTVFLYFFLDNPRARSKYVFKYVTQSTISGINNKGVNSILIYVPPIELQNQFASRITLIEQQKELAKKSLEESENLFNTLLQKAFKGEIEVSEAEEVTGV